MRNHAPAKWGAPVGCNHSRHPKGAPPLEVHGSGYLGGGEHFVLVHRRDVPPSEPIHAQGEAIHGAAFPWDRGELEYVDCHRLHQPGWHQHMLHFALQ